MSEMVCSRKCQQISSDIRRQSKQCLLVRNITTISMKGDEDTFEDLVLLLNTNSSVSFQCNPQNFNGKIHHVIHLLEALIFLRFISLVKLCRLFEIELFDEDGDDDNDDYAVIGNSMHCCPLGGISMSSSLPALSFPRHLICHGIPLICVILLCFGRMSIRLYPMELQI